MLDAPLVNVSTASLSPGGAPKSSGKYNGRNTEDRCIATQSCRKTGSYTPRPARGRRWLTTSLCALFLATSFAAGPAQAQLPSLIPQSALQLFANEVSGVSAKRHLDTITVYHRTRASSEFRFAAEHVLSALQQYSVPEARILEYPADGKTLFGTQKSRLAWEAEFAELWELDSEGKRTRRHASWEAMPLSLAQDSVSGKVSTTLVDIGAGLTDADYAGLDVNGRLVLTSSQPEQVVAQAVAKRGAAGIISYAANQKSAWWKQDDRLVRWGHMGSFGQPQSFGFMISLATARQFQARLQAGENIGFSAEVRASTRPGKYALVTARIPGADAALRKEEVIFSCHLDHPRPGANDNASGCVSILEAARTLQQLIASGALPRPARSLRFIWPAEIEGTLIYLTSLKDTRHIKANIHLDMVGGGHQTRSVFRISGGPLSVASFVGDLGHEIGQFVNDQTLRYASGETVSMPLVSAEGSRNPQLAIMEYLAVGSDHEVFNAGSWGVPGIYLHDWPDRYIHTNFDTAAMIDPTKLKRAAFIAAVQGWYLANISNEDVEPLLALLRSNALQRSSEAFDSTAAMDDDDRDAVLRVWLESEQKRLASVKAFAAPTPAQSRAAETFITSLGDLLGVKPVAAGPGGPYSRVYRRNPEVVGTMHAFGYSYLSDKLSTAQYQVLTLDRERAYEALNLVDGKRSVRAIRNWLLAQRPPVAMKDVDQYLRTLEDIGVLQ